MKLRDMAIVGGVIAGGAYLYKKIKSPVQIGSVSSGPDTVKTSPLQREADAASIREGSPVSTGEINERMKTQRYRLSQAQQSAERLMQQNIDIGARLAAQAQSRASFKGTGKSLLHRVRQDGKIFVYKDNQFIGFEVGPTADAYKEKFYKGQVPSSNKISKIKDGGVSRNQFISNIGKPQKSSTNPSLKALKGPKKSALGKYKPAR